MNHRPIDYEVIPVELKARPQWVLWRRGMRDNKPTKLPVQRDGSMASSTDPATWLAFDEARAAYEAAPQRFDGIGYVFAADDPYFGVDVDDCITDSKVSAEAQRIIDECSTYCEVSPSGCGVKMILRVEDKSRLPRGATLEVNSPELRRLEVYPHGRYFAMTGHHLPGTRKTIETRQQQAEALLKRCIDGSRKAKARPKSAPASGNGKPRANRMARALKWMSEHRAHADENDGSRRLVAVCAAAKRAGLDAAETVAAVRLYERCEPFPIAYTNDEIARRWADSRAEPTANVNGRVQVAERGERRRFACTDMGNGERLARHFGGDCKYVAVWSAWYIWSGSHWKRDTTGEVTRLAKRCVRGIIDETRDEDDDARRSALLKWAASSESAARIDAILRMAQSEPAIAMNFDAFDADPMLFNLANGTIDLRTGQLREHRRDDLLTKMSPVAFDPSATLPQWDRFIADATGGDTELAGFLRRSVGYSMTGSTSEERFWFIHGPGASGKSTFIEAIKAAFGDYAVTADFESFLARHNSGGGARGDLARLAGARLVTSVEVDDGRKLAEGLVKQLTGGDKIPCRRLYESEFEYHPQFTLWLVANHKPKVRHDDDAIWRRVLLTPFDRAVPESKRDPALKSLLTDPDRAGAAILAWAVRGCLEWQHNGLQVPKAVSAATAAYRADMDPLADFYADCCTFRPNETAYQHELLAAYRKWAESVGIRHPLNRTTFGPALREHGEITEGECSITRRKQWSGISLRRGDTP